MQKNVYLGSENGKAITKTVYGKTAKELRQKEADVHAQYKKGLATKKSRDTFAYWSKEWKAVKYLNIGEGQQKSYDSYFNHLKDLDDLPVSRIRPADVQAVAVRLGTTPSKRTGKPLSSKTIREVISTAEQVLAMAVLNRLIDYNPASGIIIPVSEGEKKEPRRALTDEEQRWILETPHDAQCAAMIMMYAGLRRGELIPLTWDDIHLKAGTIQVNKAVEMIDGQPVIKPTGKTPASIRTIPIPTALKTYLRAIQKESKSTLVCCSNGKMYTDSGWKSLWNSYLADLNLKYGNFSDLEKQPTSKHQPEQIPLRIPHFTAHWLRHTYATMLYLSGVDPLTARDLLGHADIQTTLNIYTHLDTVYKKKQIYKLDKYISKKQQGN